MGAESSDADVLITEIGGTTGDIESQPFLEAIRQVSLERGRENCCFIHVTLVPWLSGSNEHKSKPTQHSVKELQSLGIAPDIIVCRVDRPLEQSIKDKISLFCNVPKDCVIKKMIRWTAFIRHLLCCMSMVWIPWYAAAYRSRIRHRIWQVGKSGRYHRSSDQDDQDRYRR